MNTPCLIDFDTIGDESSGFLVTTQQKQRIPFEVKRVFWVHGTPQDVIRGQHAHYQTEMILVSLHAMVTIEVEDMEGHSEKFILDQPNLGLYLPVMHWTRIYLSPASVLLCLASSDYSEEDYIRDYNYFRTIIGNQND